MADENLNTTTSAEALRVNEKKWTKPLMDAGWTCIPTVIIERQQVLGLVVAHGVDRHLGLGRQLLDAIRHAVTLGVITR